jgi:hypothetical protein
MMAKLTDGLERIATHASVKKSCHLQPVDGDTKSKRKKEQQ